MKEVYKIVGDKIFRLHFTMSQWNALKFAQYYNTKQWRNHGSFPLDQWLLSIRNEFEIFHISCNPFDYLLNPTTPITTVPTHDPIKDFMRGIKWDNSNFPKFKDENNGMNGITKPKHKPDLNL